MINILNQIKKINLIDDNRTIRFIYSEHEIQKTKLTSIIFHTFQISKIQ
jgi:hypothetical protein